MKIKSNIHILLLSIIFISCRSGNHNNSVYKDKNTVSKNENLLNVKDYDFKDTDIEYEVLSKKDGYIEKVRISLKADNRLKNMSSVSDIKLININIWNRENSISIHKYISEELKIYQKDDILIFDLDISSGKMKNIDTIACYFHLDNLTNKIIENTESFYYKNSVQLLGLENTFMDTTGFKKANVLIKNDSIQNNYCSEIGLTIKVTNQEIDDVKNIQVNILSNNKNHQLDFVYNINPTYLLVEQLESHGTKLIGSTRPGKNYICYSINIEKLKLKDIDSISVKLNDKVYYSNKLSDK